MIRDDVLDFMILGVCIACLLYLTAHMMIDVPAAVQALSQYLAGI